MLRALLRTIFSYTDGRLKSLIAIVRQDGFEQHLKMIFDKYNIDFPYLPPKAVRNYYQQQVSEYLDREGYNPMLAEKLAKHSISNSR